MTTLDETKAAHVRLPRGPCQTPGRLGSYTHYTHYTYYP
jgi:hypothetical protein